MKDRGQIEMVAGADGADPSAASARVYRGVRAGFRAYTHSVSGTAADCGKTRESTVSSRTGMKRPLGSLLTFALTFVAALVFAGSALAEDGPSLISDHETYAPGAKVTLTGAGWLAGDTVHVRVDDNIENAWDFEADLVAALDGSIATAVDLPSFASGFGATATGGLGGSATTSFTSVFAVVTAPPAIVSDQADYPPGGLVTLNGANWAAGEKVHIFVNDLAGQSWSRDVDVTADPDGNLTDQFNLPDWFVAEYSVKATGASGATATTMFTDSNATWFNPGSAGNFPNEPQPTTGVTVKWSTYQNTTTCSGTATVETAFQLASGSKVTAGSGGLNKGNALVLTDVQINSGDTTGLVFAYITSDAPTGPKYSLGSCVPVTQNGNASSFYFHYSHRPTANAQSVSATAGVAKTITLTGTDVDGENLTFQKTGAGPSHGTLGAIGTPTCTVSGGTSTCSATVTYTSAANYTGPDSFQFTVTDASTLVSAPATVSITVSPSNTAPSCSAGSATTNEDTAVAAGLTCTDPEGDSLTYTIVSGPSNGTLSGTGASRTYTPNANYNGSDSFTYKANDGSLDSNTVTFSITVNPVNDAPSFTKGANETVNEDAAAQTVTSWATAISPGPANESTQTVSFIVTNDNNGLFSTQPAVSSTGTLTYTLAANASGSATVSVKAKDNGGTANGGVDESAIQTFTDRKSVV